MWVLAMAPLLGFVWAMAMLDVGSQRSFMRLWRSCKRWGKAMGLAMKDVGYPAKMGTYPDVFYEKSLF
jgi:hypothetical protein